MLPCHGNLIQVDSVFEDELIEGLLPQGRLHRCMAHLPGARPGAVEPGEVTRPEKVSQADLRYATKPALLLHLECEEDLTLHELGWLVRKQNVGSKDTGCRTAPVILTIEAPEDEWHPTNASLFEDKAHAGMAIADARENDCAQELGHEPHGEVHHRHERLIPGFQARDADADLPRSTTRVRVQVDRQTCLRGRGPDRLPHLMEHRLGSVHPVEDDSGRKVELR